ncbi:MAG: hypothetical protein CMJ49_01395 [Planctomycetaceae bacterium]|nr:hypothetical protein [Planctomycetaceae bacterium]
MSTIQLPAADTHRRRRPFRVAVLLIGMVLFGLGDLYATLMHSLYVGMHETNPIGAYLIAEQSIWGLILFKLGTLGLSAGLLLKVRHHLSAELACWALLVVMILVTVYWHAYNHQVLTMAEKLPVADLPPLAGHKSHAPLP